MTYPPTPQASPLHHRHLLFALVYAVIAAGLGAGLRALSGRDLDMFYLITLVPTSVFLYTLPPPFTEYRYWLKRLAWWTLAAALGLATWVGILMLLDGSHVLIQLLIATILAELVLIGTLQYGWERQPSITWRTIVIMAAVLGAIYAGIMLSADNIFDRIGLP